MSHAVVVLSFNHPQLTERCVRSVLAQGERPILIHNGSRPETVELLKSTFPQIEHRELSENRGFSGGANFGLNEGFKLADRLLFLTNDCELLSPAVAPTEPGLRAPLIWRRKIGDIDSLGGQVDLRTGTAMHSRCIDFKPSDNKHFYIPGSAFWLDRASFLQLGEFDERLGTYWEDIEISLRAKTRNVQLGVEPETKILHRVGKTCHKDPRYTSYLYQRNRFIVCWSQLKTGRFRFAIAYWLSISRLMVRKIRTRQWKSLALLFHAVRDGWRMRLL